MAFNLGPLFQSFGDAGSQVGSAQIAAARERVNRILDQLGIQQSQVGLKEANERLRRLQGAPANETEKYQGSIAAFKNIFGRDPTEDEKLRIFGVPPPPAPKKPPNPLQEKIQALYDLGIDVTPEMAKRLAGIETKEGVQTPAASAEYADYVKSLGHPPTAQDILNYRHPKTAKAGGAGEFPEKTLKALADKWQNEGIKPPAKYQAAVEEYMEANGMKGKIKLTAPEQQLKDLTAQMEPKVSQLKKIIEDNGIQNDNSLIFGKHSSLAQAGRFYGEYKRGVKPEQVTADLIKTAAALQVMGAGPWMRIGRGKYLYETIIQHLPSPTDNPALLYDKANFLQGIIDEARSSLPDSGEQGAAPATELFFDSKGNPVTKH